MDRNSLVNRLVQVTPTPKQLNQQEMEFYGFIHFTVNTFTGKEWGDGSESPSIFNPEKLDTDQWAEVAKAAGMKGLILTCKHHDGFCLWPSKYTEHSVKNSPLLNGQADVFKMFADSCRKYGLQVGVYLSPWDRNHETYGYGEPYNDYFTNQLTELLTNYGEIFTVWFDGACGEGKNGKKQVYDWKRYYELINRLQPNATISICGPDIRWCGNEAGVARDSEWSVVSSRMADNEKIASESQQEDNAEFRQQPIKSQDQDLGSVERLQNERNFIWYPAEMDVSIRPGWFYHPEEDDKVKTPDQLMNIYMKSVGGNSMLLLNLPPNTEGRIAEQDAKILREFGSRLDGYFAENLLKEAKIEIGSQVKHAVDNVRVDSYDSHFEPLVTEEEPVEIEISFEKAQDIRFLVIKENILESQRVEEFEVSFSNSANTAQEPVVITATTIGYKKIVCLPEPILADKIKIVLKKYRVCPKISFIGVY